MVCTDSPVLNRSKLTFYAKEAKQLVLNVLGTMRKECAKGASSSSIIKRTAPLTNGSECTPAQVDVTKGIERRFCHSIWCCMLAEWSCFCAWSRGIVDCPHDSRYAIFVTADRHHTPYLVNFIASLHTCGLPEWADDSKQTTSCRGIRLKMGSLYWLGESFAVLQGTTEMEYRVRFQ